MTCDKKLNVTGPEPVSVFCASPTSQWQLCRKRVIDGSSGMGLLQCRSAPPYTKTNEVVAARSARVEDKRCEALKLVPRLVAHDVMQV
jgi:hypothetical protein